MYGIFHATYVLSRIVRFFRLAAKLYPSRKGFANALSMTERQFNKGIEVVLSSARCTELGSQIMRSLVPTTNSLL